MSDKAARLAELYTKRKARADKSGLARNVAALDAEIARLEAEIKADAEGEQ